MPVGSSPQGGNRGGILTRSHGVADGPAGDGAAEGSMTPSPDLAASPPAVAAYAPRRWCRHDVVPGQGAPGAAAPLGAGARPSAGVRALRSSRLAASRSPPLV